MPQKNMTVNNSNLLGAESLTKIKDDIAWLSKDFTLSASRHLFRCGGLEASGLNSYILADEVKPSPSL